MAVAPRSVQAQTSTLGGTMSLGTGSTLLSRDGGPLEHAGTLVIVAVAAVVERGAAYEISLGARGGFPTATPTRDLGLRSWISGFAQIRANLIVARLHTALPYLRGAFHAGRMAWSDVDELKSSAALGPELGVGVALPLVGFGELLVDLNGTFNIGPVAFVLGGQISLVAAAF